VLDLGCGQGALLAQLKARGNRGCFGVEISEGEVIACVQRGLDVIQADLNKGLATFTDKQFEVVVLSQTLQTVLDIDKLISEMLRVGKRCIVSFPNFAYDKLRRMLAEQGRAPEAPGLLKYKWYNSPNVRFFSIADFEAFCQERKIKIHKQIALNTEADAEVADDANLHADMAIFAISR
jgi:homoserine O-acetyltransferase/O-succinyltransferase